MSIADKLQTIAKNEPKVYDAGVKKIIEKPIIDLKIPEDTKSLRPYCFYKCDGLENIDLPSTMQTVNESAFEACNGITSLIIPTGLNIGKNAFANMANLETVHFSGKPKSINPLAFMGSSAKDIFVPWDEGDISGAPWGANNATIHYAIKEFLKENYSTTTVNLNGIISKNINNISYRSNSENGSFKTVDGVLVWQIGDIDSFVSSRLGNIATMYSDRVNYKIVLSRNGTQTLPRIICRIIIKKSPTGEALTSNVPIYLFKVNVEGGVTLGDTDKVLATLSTEPTAIYISVDFRSGIIEYCDENYNPKETTYITSTQYNGANANSANELRRCAKDYLLYIYGSKGEAVKIHAIEVSEGAVEYTLLPDECFSSEEINWWKGDIGTGELIATNYGIVDYYGTSPTVIIPKEHAGKTIEGLSSHVFTHGHHENGQLFLPSTITSIGNKSFGTDEYNQYFKEIFVPWSEGENKINPAPWGAVNATIHYDYDTDGFYE